MDGPAGLFLQDEYCNSIVSICVMPNFTSVYVKMDWWESSIMFSLLLMANI